MTESQFIDRKIINTIKVLAMEGVQKANSGHPGMPMGAAAMAHAVWSRFLRHNPDDPDWINRDRFVLSAGHASMLLYTLLHLSGYDVSLDDLKSFRQFGSKTPGHPEFGHTPGVETTTGALGQGFSNGVGMALAEKMLAERFNTDAYTIIDNRIFAFVSDGDLMEGVTAEAASIAGHLKLGNLVYLYDDNHITIDGGTEISFTESVADRFQAYGWQVLTVDGLDYDAVCEKVEQACAETQRPSLIICRTTIADGSPNMAGTSKAHGSPLGDEEVAATKKVLGWPEESFYVPEEVREYFSARKSERIAEYESWNALYREYAASEKDKYAELERVQSGKVCEGLDDVLPEFAVGEAVATRSSGGKILNALASCMPEIVGGAADLAASTKTDITDSSDVTADSFSGRNIRFGIREHAMGSILNGMALYGGFIPYGSTFLVFADYMRPPIRLAAIMGLRVVYIFTHDSIFVGEDGPTHQPVEQITALRCIPGLTVIRPADAVEAGQAWLAALHNTQGPTAIMLTRQNVPTLDRNENVSAEACKKGAYTLKACASGKPELVLLASGSEVEVALGAANVLAGKGREVNVVSMPSWELFDAQDDAYRASVIPEGAQKVVVEACSSQGWHKYAGHDGLMICMDEFGKSGPYKTLAENYGFTTEKVVERIEKAGL